MKSGCHNMLKFAGLAAAICCVAGRAQAQGGVVFLDGGYTELCSMAAHNVDDPKKIEITGSRLEITPLELCTRAIASADAGTANIAGSYNNRGVLLFAEGELEGALSDFEQALRLNETLAIAHVNRGYTLVGLERWAESITAFDRGIELGVADLAKAHFNRGIAHEELGNVRAAYQDYLKAAELNPEWDEPRRELQRFSVRGQ